MSPLLFKMVLEKVVRDSGVELGTLITKACQIIGFADDIDIAGRNLESVISSFIRLEDAAKKAGLVINYSKTKYMFMTRSGRRPANEIEVGNQKLETVDSFVYLGSKINASNSASEEIQARILAGNRSFFSLKSIFQSSVVSRSTKIKAYKVLIRPVILYGSETWSPTKNDEELLKRFERKMLRRIYGPIRVSSDMFRIRYNHELSELYAEPNIVGVYRGNRLRWLGHLERMSEERTAKKVYRGEMQGRRMRGRPRRMRGRPRSRWKDAVLADLREVKGDIRDSADRQKWRSLCSEVQSQFGMSYQ